MKHYRLKKDLPTFKAGDKFELDDAGNLWHNRAYSGIVAYAHSTITKFPSIFADWFEEIPEEPKTVWDLKTEDIFYVIEDGRVAGGIWNYGDYTTHRDAGDVFLTKDEAEKELARRKAKVILERDTKGFKPNVYDLDEDKYYAYYDAIAEDLDWGRETLGYHSHQILFRRAQDVEASIKVHKKEWKIYLGVEK